MDQQLAKEGLYLVAGLVFGFFSSCIVLRAYWIVEYKIYRKTVTEQYVNILNNFGIKRNGDGAWSMHPIDKDAIWIKKETKNS